MNLFAHSAYVKICLCLFWRRDLNVLQINPPSYTVYALNSLYSALVCGVEELYAIMLRSDCKPRLWVSLLYQRACGGHSGSVGALLISIQPFLL